MQLGQRDEKWVLLDDDKQVVATYETKAEAIQGLREAAPKQKTEGCRHGNLSEERIRFGKWYNIVFFGRVCRDCREWLPRA